MTDISTTLKNSSMLLVWILIGALAAITMLRECSGNSSKVILTRDTLRMKADSVIVVRENIKPVYVRLGTRVDTLRDTIIKPVIMEREVVRDRMVQLGISELLVLDSNTVLPFEYAGHAINLPIQITDTCDCTSRSIRTVLRMKDTTMLITTSSQPTSKDYSLGVGISAGITSDGRFAATLAFSLSRVLATF